MGRKTKRKTNKKDTSHEVILDEKYYDPKDPSGYGGVEKLRKRTGVRSQKLQKWLEAQETYTLHKPVRYKFDRRAVIVNGIDDQWQLDLIDTGRYAKENNGVKFLLTIIDVFSKYAWVRPLQNKTGTVVKNAFQSVLQEGRKPRIIQTDKGKEFLNNTFQQYLRACNIDHFTTENEDIKASVVERFNRTLQTKLHRYFTKTRTHKYMAVLQDIAVAYNNTKHRAIGIAPNAVTSRNSEDIFWRLYEPKLERRVTKPLKVGDNVRINKTRRTFRKGYLPSWTTEIFTVYQIQSTTPVTYKIKDWGNKIIRGSFYAAELQRVIPPELFDIESVIDQRKRKGKTEYLIKWLGYPASFNSWVPESFMKRR